VLKMIRRGPLGRRQLKTKKFRIPATAAAAEAKKPKILTIKEKIKERR
jgi:DNA polymerase III delta subunit